MVVIKLEIWPGGDESKARPLGRIDIANDNTGTEESGNYKARLYHAGRFWGRPGFWKFGSVQGYRRLVQSPYHLVLMALKSALGQ